jgi:hypothetical protein
MISLFQGKRKGQRERERERERMGVEVGVGPLGLGKKGMQGNKENGCFGVRERERENERMPWIETNVSCLHTKKKKKTNVS